MYGSLRFFFLRNGADPPVWFTQMPLWTSAQTLGTRAAERFANHKAGHFVLRLFQALSGGVDTAWCLLREAGQGLAITVLRPEVKGTCGVETEQESGART